MVIVHIASIRENPYDGVCVAVPKHIIYQSQYSDLCFVNINNTFISCIEKQYEIKESDIKSLPSPYNHPDLVVFHEVYKKEYLVISKKLRKNKIPYIIIPHGCLSKEAQHKKFLKKNFGNLLFFNSFINNSLAIQCLSDRELSTTYFGKNKFVSSNGITIPKEINKSFHSDRINITYIGRLDSYVKGLDLLVEAVSKIKSKLLNKNIFINIYGPDIYGRKQILQNDIDKFNVGDIIKIFDPVTGKEKENVLLNSDVFIQTSRFEGMPMGILEALSFGIPCIVTDGTTLGDFIKKHDAGISCETSVMGIYNALLDLINDPEAFFNKSINAKNSVKNEFSWDHVSKEAVNNYFALLKNNT